MPTIMRLHLIPQNDLIVEPAQAPGHALLLKIVSSLDADWSQREHASPEKIPKQDRTAKIIRSFTVSPLYYAPPTPLTRDDLLGDRVLAAADTLYPATRPAMHGRREDTEKVRIPKGKPVTLRISLAEDALAVRLLEKLTQDADTHYRLGNGVCRLARVPEWTSADPDLRHMSWEQMAQTTPADRIRLTFTTPTLFSSQGTYYLLPDPVRLWNGWREIWEHLGGALPMQANFPDRALPRISEYRLETIPCLLKGGLFIGFCGWVELTWPTETPSNWRQAALALANVAPFFGVGAKTALGLGQTRLQILSGSRSRTHS